jgi:hypothetical protein
MAIIEHCITIVFWPFFCSSDLAFPMVWWYNFWTAVPKPNFLLSQLFYHAQGIKLDFCNKRTKLEQGMNGAHATWCLFICYNNHGILVTTWCLFIYIQNTPALVREHMLNCFSFNFLTLAGSKCSLFVSPAAWAPASGVAEGLTIPF